MEMIPLCSVEIDVGEKFEIGKTGFGQRLIGEIVAARWQGNRFKAKMVGAASADWALTTEDGLIQVDVRMTLETDDGELVYVSYTGLLDTAAENAPCRTAIRFETAADRYQWLTRTLCVGDGRFDGDKRVTYDIFVLQ